MSWKEAIAAALQPPMPPDEMNPFACITREVIAYVNETEPAVCIEMQFQSVKSRQHIDVLMGPAATMKYERQIMFSLSIDNNSTVIVSLAGGGVCALGNKDPETLRAYLVEFFTSAHFIDLVDHYRARNAKVLESWHYPADWTGRMSSPLPAWK